MNRPNGREGRNVELKPLETTEEISCQCSDCAGKSEDSWHWNWQWNARRNQFSILDSDGSRAFDVELPPDIILCRVLSTEETT